MFKKREGSVGIGGEAIRKVDKNFRNSKEKEFLVL
jgi:hypothetical protein